MIMEEFKKILSEINEADWTKRLKGIDSLIEFTKNNLNIIK